VEGSIVVALDISMGVAMRGRWDSRNQAAVAVLDAVREECGVEPPVAAYNENAWWLDASELAELDFDYVYGANVQHALEMARGALDGATGHRRILFIADSEPDAYCDTDGSIYFNYPPVREMVSATLSEARYCQLAGVRCDFLLLSEASPFTEFATKIATACGGSVGALSEVRRVNEEVRSFLSQVGIT
jgi:uncharacterized protein with von Willebrand factor type A (vWA) domain